MLLMCCDCIVLFRFVIDVSLMRVGVKMVVDVMLLDVLCWVLLFMNVGWELYWSVVVLVSVLFGDIVLLMVML